MNARPLAPRLEVVADDHQASPIKVVGVYADLPSHLLAMGVFRNIARQCSAACEFNESWWSFDMLASASMRSTAVGLAAESDMIWCSTHACKALPKPITEWVEAWLPRRSEPAGALVVLLRCPSNYKVEQSPSRAYLEQLARAAAMELFVQRFDCACGVSLNQAAVPLQIRKQIDEYHPDWKQIRHWGINE